MKVKVSFTFFYSPMIDVLVLPPSESCRRRVNLDSLQNEMKCLYKTFLFQFFLSSMELET